MVDDAAARALVERYVAAWDAGDRAAYLGFFADGATVEDPVGSQVRVGPDEIAAFWDEMIAMAAEGSFELQPDSVRVCGDAVAFMFRVTTPAGDQSMVMEPIDVFELDEDVRITSMRAYWGPSDMRLT